MRKPLTEKEKLLQHESTKAIIKKNNPSSVVVFDEFCIIKAISLFYIPNSIPGFKYKGTIYIYVYIEHYHTCMNYLLSS